MATDVSKNNFVLSCKESEDGIGLYIHIPFCKQKCLYCDFCSSVCSYSDIEKYTEALIHEAEEYRQDERILVNTVFFGGGTPSILPINLFEKILSKLKENFKFSENVEFTIEANPKTLSAEKLYEYKRLGVNRISIGLQSVHENELKKLGRIHNFDDFLLSYQMVLKAGFDNVNVDLMYGIPEQTLESFATTLDKVIMLSPSHISCYGLIIEDGTPFSKMQDRLNLPDEDTEAYMYEMACNRLRLAGYSHYEISNYAKDGYACRHNLKYWLNKEYIGIGISAHSYFKGRRYFNKSDFTEYFSSQMENYRMAENDFTGIDKSEYIMLRLRLKQGLNLSEYKLLFNENFIEGKEDLIKNLVSSDLLYYDGIYLSLTEKGFYLSNGIISSFM